MNGADAASRGGFRDSKDASELLLRLAETYQRRYLCRLNEAGAVKAASLAPLVRTHLQNKVKRLEEEALVTVKFQDPPVNTRGSCGGKEVDQEPCACLVKAALISGFDVSKLLHERESTATWKRQYMGLPQFDLPSTEEIDACPADKFLVAASSYPTPRGRPSTKRLKGAIDFWGKK